MAKYDSYPFTNISKESVFIGEYDKEKYEIKPGEIKFFPAFIVNGFCNQWLDWAVNTAEFGYKKKDGFDKQKFISEKRAKLDAQLRAFPEKKEDKK